jgi:hypothetical protein
LLPEVARAMRAGARTGRRFTIGLGAVTLTSGSAAGSLSANAGVLRASQLAPAANRIRDLGILIFRSRFRRSDGGLRYVHREIAWRSR